MQKREVKQETSCLKEEGKRKETRGEGSEGEEVR